MLTNSATSGIDDSPYERLGSIAPGFWKARKRGTNRLVLLEIKDGNEETLSRQLDVLYSCSHPSILEFFGAWLSGSHLHVCKTLITTRVLLSLNKPTDGVSYSQFILEFCEGTLDTLNIALSEPELKCVLRAILKALTVLHSSGVVHRHVQLSSVWLTSEGVPKLGGLSVAQRLPSTGALDQSLNFAPWLPPDVLPGSGLFGVALNALYEYHALGGALRLVSAASRFVAASHLQEVGLFRVSANHTELQKLRLGFICLHRSRLYKLLERRKSGNAWNLATADPAAEALLQAAGPHCAAALLVSFLLDLPEPLIPLQLHDPLLSACEASLLSDVVRVLRLLPRPHTPIFRLLLSLLHAVAANSEVNKMTKQNLGAVLGPAFFRKPTDSSDTAESVMREAKRESVATSVLIEYQPQLADALEDELPSEEEELPPDTDSTLPTLRSGPYGTEVDIWSVGMLARRLCSANWQPSPTPELSVSESTASSFIDSCLQATDRPAADVLLKHPWLIGSDIHVKMPPVSSPLPDLQSQVTSEAVEKMLVEADALLKRSRAAVHAKDSAAAETLLRDTTADYRNALAAVSADTSAHLIPELRRRAWFGLARVSVLLGQLLEADERLRLAASASTQLDARVLRYRALVLYRIYKRPADTSVQQPSACISESCRLFAATEKLLPVFTARWLQRWARAVDIGCSSNAPESFASREAWYRVFKTEAEKPEVTVNLKPLIGFAAQSNNVHSRPMMLLSELSVRGGTAELRRVAYTQAAALAELLTSQTTQPLANGPLPSEQLRAIKGMKLTEAEVRRNYTAFLTAFSFGKHAEKIVMGKVDVPRDENYGPELLSESPADVVWEDALTETWESRFEGKDSIGHGGFATVFRCKRKFDNRVVAVKVLTSPTRANIRAVLREAKLLRDLKHPNVVSFLGCLRLGAQGVMHVVMEFCDGGTLRTLCANTHLSEGQVAFITREILQGLAYLHSVNVVHRDIKSENILLNMSGDVRIADFGIAESWGVDCKATEDDAGRLMKPCGTPRYMSPEIIRAHPCGRKMDLYSLGAVLYEMMEGEAPYTEELVVKACFLTATRGLPAIECKCSEELKLFYRDIGHLDPHRRPSAVAALNYAFPKSATTRADIRNIFSVAFFTRTIAEAGL